MDIISQLLQTSTPVYNRYLTGDFSVGVDNLNPKRELETDTLANLESLRLSLYLRYKDQIKALKGDSSLGAATDLGLPYVNRTKVTATVSLREGMAPSDTPVSTDDELYKMLQIVDSFLGGEPITLSDLPFDICGDRTGETGEAEGSSSTTPGGATVTSGLTGADNTGTQNSPSLGDASTSSDMKCIYLELEMLQAVFKLLEFVRWAIGLEKKALALIYPYIEFIQMVVACILNPAMRQQLIMSLVGQVWAVIISFLTDSLAKMLGNLNLDCLLSNSMSSVQQVMGAVAAVTDTGSAVGSFINFNANTVSKAADLANAGAAALQGDETSLYKALGIPQDKQQESQAMSAGELFDAVLREGIAVPINTAAGLATAVVGTTVGTAQTLLTSAVNTVSSASASVEQTAKLLKDYFPDAEIKIY